MQTPLPKSSLADTEAVTILSSITNFVSYNVAVNAPPEPIFKSTIFVSCKSNVVAPKSKFIILAFENFSAPITTLVFHINLVLWRF
jgi:hypothetical protein